MMAGEVAHRPFPILLKGMSQKSPNNLGIPGELVNATNMQILKGRKDGGGFEFTKRYGASALSTTTDSPSGSTVTNPYHITTLGKSLVLDNAQAVFSRNTAKNEWIIYNRSGFNFTSSTDVISESMYQKVCPAHAYDAASGNEITAWYDGAAGVKFSIRGRDVFDWAGHEVDQPSTLAFQPPYKVQAFAPGDGYFYLFSPKVAGTSMLVTRIVAAYDPLLAVSSFTINLDPTTTPFDVQQLPEGTFLIAARVVASANTQIGVWDPATQTFGTTATIATDAATKNMSWLSQNPFAAGVLRKFYFATCDGTNGTRLWQFSNTLGTDSTTVKDAAAGNCNFMGYRDTAAGVTYLFYDIWFLGIPYNAQVKRDGAVKRRSVSIASRAFLIGAEWYALARYDSVIQPTLFLLQLSNNCRVVGKVGIEGAQWSTLGTTYGQPPWVTQIGAKALIPVMAAHTSIGATVALPLGTQIQGVSLVTFDSSPSVSKPSELNGVLHYPGSIPWIFDGGNNAVESGFNVFPETVTITDNGSGTSKSPGKTYSFRATYEWRDTVGNVYESAPSPTVGFVAASAHDLLISIPAYRLTERLDVMVNVYGDDPSQPGVFRRKNSTPILNTTFAADAVTFVDTVLDNSVQPDWATNRLLYAGDGGNGQPYEHLPPPSCTMIATAQSRNFVAGVDQDKSAVWVSNEAAPGEGISYFDGIVFRVTGEVTGIVGRDRNVVVFTDSSIWTVTGEFPDNAGGSFAIPTPFRLPHATGAIPGSPLIVSSIGIFYQSKKGLRLLGWDWSDQFIGGDVEDTLATSAITAGLEVPTLCQVRLYTAAGNTLVWDTEFKTWMTFAGQAASSACTWKDVACYVGTDGVVWQETPGAYADGASFIPSTLEFLIMSPAGLRGYFCLFALQLLGRILGACTLNADLKYNSSSAVVTSYTFALAAIGDGVLKPEIRPKKRQAASWQLKLSDASLSGPTAGFSLQSITADLGIEGGLGRTQTTQRMTKV